MHEHTKGTYQCINLGTQQLGFNCSGVVDIRWHCREGMVQAEGQNQESQASEYDIALHEEPDAEAELLQWSGGLDFDDYTRYANAAVQCDTWPGKRHAAAWLC